MAQLLDIGDESKDATTLDPKISTYIGKCVHGAGCFKSMDTIKPNKADRRTRNQFKVETIEATETKLLINNKWYSLRATGAYSIVEIGLMWGKNHANKDRSHWGLILTQERTWCMQDNNYRKCLLIHHMGDGAGIEIGIGCRNCVCIRIRDIYKEFVANPQIRFYNYGKSNASFYRFLSEKSLCRNINYSYSTAFAENDNNLYHDWGATNCMRVVFDLLLFLKLDYKIAVNFTVNAIANEKWNQVFEEIASKKENTDFLRSIFVMWTDMKKIKDLDKVVKLVDGQYHLNIAQEMVIKREFLSTLREVAMAVAQGYVESNTP